MFYYHDAKMNYHAMKIYFHDVIISLDHIVQRKRFFQAMYSRHL